jgi:TldD protein
MTRFVNRTTLLILIFLIQPAVFCSQDNSGPADHVMQAMADELQRSMTELRLKGLESPYFIQYIVLDEEECVAEATFGALVSSTQNRSRTLHAQVRVGDYTFDNSEFIAGPGGSSTGVLLPIVIEDDYLALRHAMWLATDSAYKQAVEIFSRKRAFVQNKMQGQQTQDFSKESATRSIGTRQVLTFDKAGVEKQLRDWSRIFKAYPAIQYSAVRLIARSTHRYIVNSEGTQILQPTLLVMLEVDARTQATDGMRIERSVPFYARSFDQLPSSNEVEKSIRELISDLDAARLAPTLEKDYSGPVLLTGPAAAEMFVRVLAPNLSGQRPPLSERSQQSARGSELLDRMNRPVLPIDIAVYDDPALREFNGKGLVGFYTIDDQGIPGRRVSLVENGLLVDLLMSRRPGSEGQQSNGHGRSGYPGRETAQISNLVIGAKQAKNYEDLKQALIQLCRAERLQYGLVIKAVESSGAGSMGIPFLTYKVYVSDGHEDLIRGANPGTLTVQSLRHIQAVGDDSNVANYLLGMRGAETPASVIAPSVLLEEMDLRRPSGAQQKPALLTPPPRP